MDWDDLRFVLETVRQSGLSGAARVLGVNHATVARRIQAAEIALGARLFDRLPTGYRPTKAGMQVVKTAEVMETSGADLSRLIGAGDTSPSGSLTVTAPPLLIEHVLGPLLHAFHLEFPDIDLTVLGSNEVLNLARREADVAIRISETPHESLYGRRVTPQRSAVYASTDYVQRLEADPDEALAWLRFQHWTGILLEVKTRYPNAQIKMVFDDMAAMLGATRAHLGATRVPCFLGDRDPKLARVPDLPTFPYPSIWVLTHEDLRNVTRIAAFTGFISKRLSQMQHLFEGTAAN